MLQGPKPLLVVLAAGGSTRLGETKALVDIAGRAPLERLVAAARTACDGALVVAGDAHDEIAARLPAGCRLVHNADPRAGRTGSVQAAVRAAPGRDLCIAPVDVPLVPSSVFDSLAAAWSAAGAPPRGWLAPRHAPSGRHGHPVLVGRRLLEELSAFGPDAPLSGLRALAAPLLQADTASARVLDDLDTPWELEELRRIALNFEG